jgi:hypothetical protein
VATEPVSRGHGRRALLGALGLAAVGTPIVALTQPWASAAEATTGSGLDSRSGGGLGVAPAGDVGTLAETLLWNPNPASVGLKAFEGIEADRAGLHPNRKYIYVEGDYYRFDIYKDDRDSTGGGDRQRTESKGMVQNGTNLKMKNGETWRIAYHLYMPSTLHGTSKFTHIFQLKTPATNGGPWVTMSLSRSGSTEKLRLRAFSTDGAPDIGSTNLAPLRDKWIGVELTFKIGSSGTGRLLIRNGTSDTSPVVVDSSRSGVKIPDEGDYVRPKWGIYRSIESASSDIINTHLRINNYRAYKIT